jgi:UDP-N-acetylenolpyruvoylglucosamine reductase
MYQLIYFVKRKVEEKFQLKLTPEIKIITKNNICPLQKKELE